MNDFIKRIDSISKDIYTYGRYNDKDAVVNANAKYYQESVKSPSVAGIVYRNAFKESDNKYKAFVRTGQESLKEFTKRTVNATINAEMANNEEPAKSALHNFRIVVDKIYPHSWWIRTFSVDTDRVVLDKVKGKAGWFHKLKVGVFMKKNAITHFFK